MGVRLPAEYQETEWIEGTRNLHLIDTGIPGNRNTLIIEAKVKPGDFVQYAPLWGNYRGENYNVTRLIAYASNSILSYINTKAGGGTSAVTIPPLFGTDKTFVIRQERTKLTIDGTAYTIPATATASENSGNIAINAATTGNPSTGTYTTQRWYYFRIFDGEIILRDFIPCYRKSDMIAGMYDLVSNAFFANARTGKTSEFTAGPDVIDSISPLMVAWRRIMMAAASVAKKLVKLIATSTTGLVSFTTNVIRPVKVTCEFSPVQEGTGDPSPANVRPISGWTGCEIGHTGKNLIPSIDETVFWNTAGYLKRDGTIVYSTSYRTSAYLPVAGGHQYVFSTSDENENALACWNGFLVYDSNKQPIQDSFYERSTAKVAITVPEGGSYVRIYTQRLSVVVHRQLELGSTATVYEPYQGATLPITFTDPTTGDPLTVYGGTVTLNKDGSADLTVTSLSIEFDGSADEAWKFETTANHYKNAYIAMPSTFKTLQTTSTEMICSASPTSATKSGTIYRAEKDACYISSGKNFNFCWLDTLEIFNANDFKAWLQDGHSLQVVATLINPITYHFPNIGQLNSFLGQNNIWHNMNGSITAEYYKKQ